VSAESDKDAAAPGGAGPWHFDAVVIGSGFGGAVAAWRLLDRCPDRRVLLLERGRPYPPGSFPRRPRDMARNFWDPASGLFGMYELWSFDHAKALVCSGLGGGSLIYANVLLEKPEDSFKRIAADGSEKDWPVTYKDLEPRYTEIAETLGATPLPDAYHSPAAGEPAVPKTQQFIASARAAGFEDPKPSPVAISFDAGGGPQPGASLGSDFLHGRERRTCTLVGECDMGCNEGAKNTLDFTYLSKFAQAGGEIRTCCEATSITRTADGFEVRYLQHSAARDDAERTAGPRGDGPRLFDDTDVSARTISARVVVLAAGALGSPRLLLASRKRLPPLSPLLGCNFSSNGDLLAVARECTDTTGAPRDLAQSRGPVITAYALSRSDGGTLWLEDAGGPELAEWGWQLPEAAKDALSLGPRQRERIVQHLRRIRPRSRISSLVAGALGDAHASAAMLPMLAMGFDNAGGRAQLDRDAMSLDWDPADSAEHFAAAERATAQIASGLGGHTWPRSRRLREVLRGVTVHPLGGCAMGCDIDDGVVDGNGEVFGCAGLYVADGSVMPAAIGPNPSLTIAAVADHIATAVARDRFGAD
jgi:cholesterol oxidase